MQSGLSGHRKKRQRKLPFSLIIPPVPDSATPVMPGRGGCTEEEWLARRVANADFLPPSDRVQFP
jgi:hypothetical protein